jgi:hypothetical protein
LIILLIFIIGSNERFLRDYFGNKGLPSKAYLEYLQPFTYCSPTKNDIILKDGCS